MLTGNADSKNRLAVTSCILMRTFNWNLFQDEKICLKRRSKSKNFVQSKHTNISPWSMGGATIFQQKMGGFENSYVKR